MKFVRKVRSIISIYSESSDGFRYYPARAGKVPKMASRRHWLPPRNRAERRSIPVHE
jgi:hypothetical protein